MNATNTTCLGTSFPTQQPQPFKLLYSKADAAEMLSLSLRTIDHLIANKELAVRRAGKRVLVSYQSLLQFVRRDHATRRVQ